MTASERQGSAHHLFRLGADNQRAGRLTEAEMLYRQALEIDRDMILDAGLTDYLTKPLRKDALLQKLELYSPQLQLAS